MKETIAILLALIALLAIVGHCTACTSPQTVLDKAQIAEFTVPYGEALERCKAKGKRYKSFAIFEACEKYETQQLCNDRPGLKAAWARCLEIEQ